MKTQVNRAVEIEQKKEGHYKNVPPNYREKPGQRRSSVAGLTEDDRQTVDKERQVGDPMQLRTEVLNL